MTTRVVLADDQHLVRAGLRLAISRSADLEVVGEAATGAEAVRLVRELNPDVVLMDIRMPGMDGIEATGMIAARHPASRVLILTTFDDDENVYAALRAGASGFLVKDMAVADLVAAVRVVAAGDGLIAPSVTRRLIAGFADGSTATARPLAPLPASASVPTPADPSATRLLDGVTDREREVLILVGRGLSNAEIGARLEISAGTAKTHVGRLLAKLGARDRVQLVIIAYEAGLVSPAG